MFRIEVFDRWPGFRINGGSANYGRIRWGNGPYDYETFVAPTHFRSAHWYRTQWHRALERLLSGATSTSFVVSAENPQFGFVETWDLWNSGAGEVVMHNRLIPPPHVSGTAERFDLNAAWESAGELLASSEGERISEWRLPFSDFEEFMQDGGPKAAKPAHRIWPSTSRRYRKSGRD